MTKSSQEQKETMPEARLETGYKVGLKGPPTYSVGLKSIKETGQRQSWSPTLLHHHCNRYWGEMRLLGP